MPLGYPGRYSRDMAQPQSHPLLGAGLGLVGVTLFGATLPATKLALGGFDPAFLTFSRALLATGLGAVVLLVLRRKPPLESLWQIGIAGVLLVFGFPWLSSTAMLTVPAAHGAVVLGILPLLTATFAAMFADEIFLMKDARVVESGPPGQAITRETVRAVFGIEVRMVPHPDRDGGYVLPVR